MVSLLSLLALLVSVTVGLPAWAWKAIMADVPIDAATLATYKHYEQFEAASYDRAVVVNQTWAGCGPVCGGALANFQLTSIIPNNPTGTTGYQGLDHDNQEIIVAFRGSSSTINWVEDLMIEKVSPTGTAPYYSKLPQGAEVHAGFLASYSSVRDFMVKTISGLAAANPTYRIVFLGHSLGAALSEFAALDYYLNYNPPNMALYTFAGPRIGNAAFSNFMCNIPYKISRVTQEQDIVPHLPPESFGYFHHSKESFISVDLAGVTLSCDVSPTHCGESLACSSKFTILQFNSSAHNGGYYNWVF